MSKEESGKLVGIQVGPYVLKGLLGRGGMGEVYLAHDQTLDRPVAIKFMFERHAVHPSLVKRFMREARAAARLNHANIVQVYAVETSENRPYMVLEYVRGTSLDRLVGRGKYLPWQQALGICGQVAAALACAHEQGVIHRDIKPANILVQRDGRARVSDFGIAKVLNAESRMTEANTTIGSPFYMSPEQCGTGDVVPASDLFSLGVTLFEMLTGKLPFEAATPLGTARKIAMDPAPPLAQHIHDAPPFLQDFLDALLAKDPAHRYASATQVVEDLRHVSAGRPAPHLSALKGSSVTTGASLPAVVQGGAPTPVDPSSAIAIASATALADELLGRPTPAAPAPRVQSYMPWWAIAAVTASVLAALFAGASFVAAHRQPPAPPAATATDMTPPPPEATPDPGALPPQPPYEEGQPPQRDASEQGFPSPPPPEGFERRLPPPRLNQPLGDRLSPPSGQPPTPPGTPPARRLPPPGTQPRRQ